MPKIKNAKLDALRADPRYTEFRELLEYTLDEVLTTRKTAKTVPKQPKKVDPVDDEEDDVETDETDESEQNGASNIFDSLFGKKKS